MINIFTKPNSILIFVYFFFFINGLVHLFAEVDVCNLIIDFPNICIFHKVTGWLCPFCGMTRAFFALGKFEIIEAIKLNILSPILFYGVLVLLVRENFNTRIEISLIKNVILNFFLILFLGYGVIRNL